MNQIEEYIICDFRTAMEELTDNISNWNFHQDEAMILPKLKKIKTYIEYIEASIELNI